MTTEWKNKKIKKWAFLSTTLIAFGLLTGLQCGKGGDDNPSPGPPNPPAAKTFTNPLFSSGPDPYVIESNDVYYYTHTLGNRIGLWKTTAMSKLSTAPYTTVFTPPASGPNSRDIWAPEMHTFNGKWYIYYTAGDGSSSPGHPFLSQRTFVLENSNADPTGGTWQDKGRIYNLSEDFWAIDGTVMQYNGSNYFLWSGHPNAGSENQNIYISKMTNPWTLEGDRILLSQPQYDWEKNGDPDVNEGPEFLKGPTGKVFLIYSASGCWTDEYALGMLTLKDGGNPLNPSDWTKSATPVFTKNASNGVYGPGHNSFFKSQDGTEDWLLYHANALPGLGCGDARSPRMQKFTWNADGTPNFGTPVKPATPLPVPSGE